MMILRRRNAHHSNTFWPTGYRQVAWIERPYGNNVNIVTDLYWAHTWSARIKFGLSTIRNGMPLASNGDSHLWFYNYTNSNVFTIQTRHNGYNYSVTAYSPLDTDVHDVKYVGGVSTQEVYHNGTLVATRSRNLSSAVPDTKPLYIFARSTASSSYPYSGRIYLVQIWDLNHNLVLDCVPCVRTIDNIAGFWDRVTRRFMVGLYNGTQVSNRLIAAPYDAEVDYLESDGTQYINTGVIPDADTGAQVTVMKLNTADRYFLGLRNDSSNTRWTIGQINSKLYYGYGSYYTNEWNNAPINTQVTASLNYLNDKKFIVEDKSAVISTLSFTPTRSIFLFGYNNKGTTSYCDCRIYNVKISQGSEIVMDLIPVRVGTTGYMYDKISGQLFGNAGSGEFILGKDI